MADTLNDDLPTANPVAQTDDPALRQRLRALIISAADKAEQAFRPAVRPMYGVTENGRADQLGSAVLVSLDGTPCLLTAAHVVDQNRATTLYVGGDNTLVEIAAVFETTVAPAAGRNGDHYDFAIAPLPMTMLVEMTTLKFITEQEMAPAPADSDRLFYTALGFPNSKNKAALNTSLKVQGQLYSYSSFARFQPALALKLDVSGREHVFIDHRKHSRDETGRKVSSIAPRGLSGGAIIQAADFRDQDILLGRKAPEPLLAAITIERCKDHQTLLGTRLDAIIPAWRAAQ